MSGGDGGGGDGVESEGKQCGGSNWQSKRIRKQTKTKQTKTKKEEESESEEKQRRESTRLDIDGAGDREATVVRDREAVGTTVVEHLKLRNEEAADKDKVDVGAHWIDRRGWVKVGEGLEMVIDLVRRKPSAVVQVRARQDLVGVAGLSIVKVSHQDGRIETSNL